MEDNEVTVFTGSLDRASTYNNVYIKLVGTDGESHRTQLIDYKGSSAFIKGAVSSFTVSCPVSIGKLVLIELDKQRFSFLPEVDWFPDKVEIKSNEEVTYTVPIYRWITDREVYYFREGTALRVFEDNHPLGRCSWEEELKRRKEEYRWDVYEEGIPHCIKERDPCSLPPEVRFSFTKTVEFTYTAVEGMIELKLEGLDDCKKKWEDMYHLNQAFWHKTPMADYVQKHWKEDVFFGYQYLNGINPMMIRRCTALPSNFPVTDDMVFPRGESSLEAEMKKGNIFLADYNLLDGVETNTINEKKQYLMAPLVLLHKTADDHLMPIAIQLKQTPADDNPIFFPTDSEYDWLMAKIFVRSADFNVHELSVHLLRTHLLAEVFTVSLLHNVPMVHPLYKLLIPHTRYTLQINILARLLLISEDGVFTKYAASGGEGMFTILKRSMSSMTYSSLCIPDDMAERGLQDVPNFHYRDDGLKLWEFHTQPSIRLNSTQKYHSSKEPINRILLLSRVKMVDYKVTVFTGSLDHATTYNDVYIKLVGTDGASDRTRLRDHKQPLAFIEGAESSFTVSCPESIGKLILIKLDKQPLSLFQEDSWLPAKVEVKSPEGDAYMVPICRWITDSKVHSFREATALRVFEDNHSLGRKSRNQELKQRKQEYRWEVYKEGIPHCIQARDPCSLPPEVRFSFTKTVQFAFTAVKGMTELRLEGLNNCKKKWKDMYNLSQVFWHKTNMAVYVQKHWKEDVFFGYQYLNGINPMLIRRCTDLPSNFPVTDDMVFPHGESSLEAEMKKGNIFLVDYKLLDGVKTNTINGKKQYLMAPLVLLHKTPHDQLMPIAIQLKQTPAVKNPIFLPTDSEYDWLMAKIFVRSADWNIHELNVHLLRTHLLAEVFTVSLLRNVPMVHPLYKLLIPHTRYTLQINIMARQLLISETGVFTKFAASGGEGMFTILKRSMSLMTYSSLCIPEDIAERGLQDVPNFHYRDDGLRLWDIINRFVQEMLGYYYKTDAEVKKDSELQKWISDIFVHGFLSKENTGIPQSFTSVAELVKFVTMVIFTCSAQHAAVNSGQYDFYGWMPNAPTSLQRPPPTKKGTTNEATMLDTFPDVNATVHGMATVWLLSKQSTDFVPLGHYPKHHFTEETPCKLIKEFQERVKEFEASVKARNGSLGVPYTYLIPTEVENSVAL